MSDSNLNTVPLTEFSASTAQWDYVRDDSDGMIGDVVLPRLFNIPMTDLENILHEMTHNGKDRAVSVRAFVGIRKFDIENNQYEMRLFLTGVNKAGEPILQQKDGDSAVYDFVTPCPPTCEGGGIRLEWNT